MIGQARKKPIVVSFCSWEGDNIEEMATFTQDTLVTREQPSNDLLIPTLEGIMRAQMGDYIIKGISEEYYPIKPWIFKETYDIII